MLLVFILLANSTGITFTIPIDWVYGLIGTIVVGVLGLFWRKNWPLVRSHFSSISRLRRAERAIEEGGPGLWLARSIDVEQPHDYRHSIETSIPIVVVANLKGGVGKTTTVANLIGHYGLRKNKRVLAIDLDFQGSLSAVILTKDDYANSLEKQADGTPSKAGQLVMGKDALWLRDVSDAVDGVPSARCIPSYYTLSTIENRVMVEWLIAKRKEDVRYTLARILHERMIQERFDIILVDAPPRLTTGCVQALCAATHVLVPTILDGLSAEASGGFVDQLATNEKLWPHLKLLGVFGNMTNQITVDEAGNLRDGPLADYEAEARQSAIDSVKAALERASSVLRAVSSDPVFPVECFIPQKSELGREAGNRIIYRTAGGSVATQQISRAFDRLGDEIDRRILAKNGQ